MRPARKSRPPTRFYTNYSDYEIYQGQAGLAQLIDMIEEFELVHRFEFSALFRNRLL
jgi:hypothetical protein